MLKRALVISLFLFCGILSACDASAFKNYIRIDSIPNVMSLDTLWRFHTGDDMQWGAKNFNDSSWISMYPNLGDETDRKAFGNMGWFRLKLILSPSMFYKTVKLNLTQAGASELYLNGKLIYSFGTIRSSGNEDPYDPAHKLCFLEFSADSIQVIAVRYSARKASNSTINYPGFTMKLANVKMIDDDIKNEKGLIASTVFLFSIFFAFSLFHLVLYLFYRKVRSNLYYSILSFILAVFWLYPVLQDFSHNPIFHNMVNWAMLYSYPLFFFLMVRLLYTIFGLKRTIVFWIIAGIALATIGLTFFDFEYYIIALALLITSSSVECLRIAIKAVRQKKPGAWIITTGFSLFILVLFSILVIVFAMIFTRHSVHIGANNDYTVLVVFAWAFSIPTSMSLYLASDFARTNKTLALQLVHVKQLAEQNIQKEKEKQQLIEHQKEMLEKQVKEKTAEIQSQKDELEEKNKEITDSITYARRIQNAILPSSDILTEALGEHFVLYKPKDVVSGDFYWCCTSGDYTIFAVADCTGHGVPGAFMSMIGNSILNEVVIDKKVLHADEILNELRATLVNTLQKSTGQTTRDGMDIALCVWNRMDNTLQYSGANNSLYWVSADIGRSGGLEETDKLRLYGDHLLEIVADKQPIGYQEGKMDNPFAKHVIQLRKGDSIYIASDGYMDQFGGEKDKKFTSKRFRDMLAGFANKTMAEQKKILNDTIEEWKKYEAQTDDICVIGVKV